MRVAQHLHTFGHAARTARDLQLERAQDDQQLLVAAQNGWTLVTHNRKDFILLHRAWQRWSSAWQVSAHHAGILIVPHRWLEDQAALEIDAFIQTRQPLANQLYEWRTTMGWMRH